MVYVDETKVGSRNARNEAIFPHVYFGKGKGGRLGLRSGDLGTHFLSAKAPAPKRKARHAPAPSRPCCGAGGPGVPPRWGGVPAAIQLGLVSNNSIRNFPFNEFEFPKSNLVFTKPWHCHYIIKEQQEIMNIHCVPTQ